MSYLPSSELETSHGLAEAESAGEVDESRKLLLFIDFRYLTAENQKMDRKRVQICDYCIYKLHIQYTQIHG